MSETTTNDVTDESVDSSTEDSAERRIPNLREQCQIGYDRLRSVLERLGNERLIAPFREVPTVNEALTFRPDLIPMLMALGWELRDTKLFRDLFRHVDTGEMATDQDTPLAPCGRSFNQIMQAHLYASARRYLDRIETEWASRRAREAEAAWRESRTEDGPLKKLLNRLKGKTEDVGQFSINDYRPHYPGHGLYKALKPHLTAEWQFGLVPFYARLRTRHIEALGTALSSLRTPLQIESLGVLTPEDLSVVRGLSLVHAEAVLGHAPGSTSLLTARTPDEVARERATRAAVEAERNHAFVLLLTDLVDCVEPLLVSGPAAETILQRLSPTFKDDVWLLFRDPKTLTRVINCPEDLLPLFGKMARSMPAEVSQALAQIKDRKVAVDLMTMMMDEIPAERFEGLLASPDCRALWVGLPARFNSDYQYEPDAPPEASSVKNRSNLRMVAGALARSFLSGEADPHL